MKRIFLFIATIAMLASCTDTTDGIGISLIDGTNDDVTVQSATFNVASGTIEAENVVSRSAKGYIGRIKDTETNSYVTCNFMTQVRGGAVTQLPDNTEMDVFDPDTITADSCELRLFFDTCYGDSLTLMKVVAHELASPLEEKANYSTSEVDAAARERFSKNGLHLQNSFTYSNNVYTSSQRATTYYKSICFPLNKRDRVDAISKDTISYGTYLLRQIYRNREKCGNDYWFVHNVCPGFYIETTGGVGCLASIQYTAIMLYYHGKKDSVKIGVGVDFAGTEEVLQKTAIMQDESKISEMAKDNECTYLKTPAGLFTQLTLPVDSIMDGHDGDTLNTTRIFIPRINNNTTTDSYILPTPSTVLLLPTDSVETFFKNKEVSDDKLSYLAEYSSTYNGYTFGNISTLVTAMYNRKKKYGETPNWNKVTIIPVETTSSTLSSGTIITKVTYDMSLGSTKLKKGSFDNANIKASVVYSHFKK